MKKTQSLLSKLGLEAVSETGWFKEMFQIKRSRATYVCNWRVHNFYSVIVKTFHRLHCFARQNNFR